MGCGISSHHKVAPMQPLDQVVPLDQRRTDQAQGGSSAMNGQSQIQRPFHGGGVHKEVDSLVRAPIEAPGDGGHSHGRKRQQASNGEDVPTPADVSDSHGGERGQYDGGMNAQIEAPADGCGCPAGDREQSNSEKSAAVKAPWDAGSLGERAPLVTPADVSHSLKGECSVQDPPSTAPQEVSDAPDGQGGNSVSPSSQGSIIQVSDRLKNAMLKRRPSLLAGLMKREVALSERSARSFHSAQYSPSGEDLAAGHRIPPCRQLDDMKGPEFHLSLTSLCHHSPETLVAEVGQRRGRSLRPGHS
eukprot:gb/GFBE01075558.1/.p1 GENE.gb/GFBE01075558.1/~~gb/GFBE01075558.1/.p1  ORF type:complete len:302 (+),score=26.57 gb/GFBE01075558.1/:1-906(+)